MYGTSNFHLGCVQIIASPLRIDTSPISDGLSRANKMQKANEVLEISADRCQAVCMQSLLSQLKLRTIKPNNDTRAKTEQGGCNDKAPLLLPLPLGVRDANHLSGRQKTHCKLIKSAVRRTDFCLCTRITCHRIRIFISKLHAVPWRRESPVLHPNRSTLRQIVGWQSTNDIIHSALHTLHHTHTRQIYYILFTALLISKCDAHIKDKWNNFNQVKIAGTE